MTNAIHIMVDLETLSTAPTAVILSLGAYDFTPAPDGGDGDNTSARGVYAVADPQWYERHPLGGRFHTSVDAALWWMQQSKEAKKELTAPESTMELPKMLDAFRAFLEARSEGDLTRVRIWGNGASFDNVILDNAYRVAGVPTPWRHWNNRCYRTTAAIFKDVPRPHVPDSEKHHAFTDAANQAAHLLEIVRKHNLSLDHL